MKRWMPILLATLLLVGLCFTGCAQRTVEGVSYTKGKGGVIEFTDKDGALWTYESSGARSQVMQDGKEVLSVSRRQAIATMSDDVQYTVQLDNDGKPTSISMPWGTDIGATQYTRIAQALDYNRLGSIAYGGTPWLVVVIMVVLLVGGVLLVVFGRKLVKANDFDHTGAAEKRLMLLRIVGLVLALVALIVLLIIIFS